jgi:hypothetical protein
VGRGHCTPVGGELGLGEPAVSGGTLELGGEGTRRLEDGAEGPELGLPVHGAPTAQGEQALPVDEPLQVEPHGGSEVVAHWGLHSF